MCFKSEEYISKRQKNIQRNPIKNNSKVYSQLRYTYLHYLHHLAFLHYLHLDLSMGQIFVAMRWRCSFFQAMQYHVFWTHVSTATDAFIWTSPSLTMFFDVMIFHDFWLDFMIFQGIVIVSGFHDFSRYFMVFMVFSWFFMVYSS